MESKDTYRVSDRYTEILGVLQKAKNGRENYLWRSPQRKLIPVSIDRILAGLNIIEASSYLFGTTSLAVGDELFLKLEFRDSSFKTKVKSVFGKNITLEFPEEMVLAEKRAEERQYFQVTDGKVLELKKVGGTHSPFSDRAQTLTVSDISHQGVALIVSPKDSTEFNINDRISLESIGETRIFPSIIGEVIFKNPHQLGSKIGIRLDTKIPKVTFDEFIVRDQLFSITEESIVRTELFRTRVHHRMDAMLKQFKLRKNLKDIFSFIDETKADQQYLVQHIRLLSEVMCGLGTTLGWVTEASMDKLIYVAYLHDAPYFNFLPLLKIHSKKEFDRVRKNLSKTEQEIFLDGPQYAADLAHHDTESFPDAVKILLQQKELPDGTGFPFGVTVSQLTPLSSLFILSHYFVDYVLAHHDWTVEDFIKTHEKRLRGQYFQKIFQLMV